MDAVLPNFKVGEADILDVNESSSMVLVRDITESLKNARPHVKEELHDDSDTMEQNQTRNCVDELQSLSVSKCKDFESASNTIDTSAVSNESTNKERSLAQNDLSANALDNVAIDFLKSTKIIQTPMAEMQCANMESATIALCVDNQTPAIEVQCASTETEKRSIQYLIDKKALLIDEIAKIMMEIHALDPDKEKVESEDKECQEEACNAIKWVLETEITKRCKRSTRKFEDMKANINKLQTEKDYYLTRIEKIERLLDDEKKSHEKQLETLVRENTLLKSKCDKLEMDLKDCKTKLIISYKRMSRFRKQMPESEDVSFNKKAQLAKSRAEKPNVSPSLCKDEKLNETKDTRKPAKLREVSFSEEGKTKAYYEKRPSIKKSRSIKSKAAKPNLSPSLQEDVKLRETENACKSTEIVQRTISEEQGKTGILLKTSPAHEKSQSRASKVGKRNVSFSLPKNTKLNDTENACKVKTETLYEKIHNVLNEFTPKETDAFVNQVRELEIDTLERLQGVIDLVFKKVVDGPYYAIACALTCKELSNTEVMSAADDSSPTNFHMLFLNRCQAEFEKNWTVDKDIYNIKLREIDECTDLEKKIELRINFELEECRLRLRSICKIIFIGEVFKHDMLTCETMHQYIRHLLTEVDDMNLECLCRLLFSIGKVLEAKEVDLSNYFIQMQQIANDKDKISSRIRFMLQDVVDLKMNKWIPIQK
ncbi:hypothetical protein TSAR_005607 [Trichomalopsis sarcophagae]|uniref:MIF4G domain-containing protein n=1 Tax=Trichomalopsis sarcophagae TaxID=543379 RepID=A0A232ET53_9HYME|nr:hypothetical protein TSAR_005607 [Trichomalopsis sarcophagae]